MKAFVTGGSGYVGRNLIRQLVARGDIVVALTRSDVASETVQDLGAIPVMRDIDDAAGLQNAMLGCDTVFHAAAEVSEWGPRERFWRVNVEGTANLLKAAQAAGPKIFVHVGTEAALCDGTPMLDMDETRTLPERPLPRYPQSKSEAEKIVRAASTAEFRTVVVRPRLIWGNDDTSVLAALVAAVKAGRYLWMDGGRYLTSTTHVDNVCEGLLLAAERGRGGEVYFVSDGAPVELREFITQLMATQGVDPGDRSVPRWLALALARAGEWIWDTFEPGGTPPVTRTAVYLFGAPVTVNDAKARRELGYSGKMTREQGLASLRAEKT